MVSLVDDLFNTGLVKTGGRYHARLAQSKTNKKDIIVADVDHPQ